MQCQVRVTHANSSSSTGYSDNIFIPYAPSLGNAFHQGHAKNIDIKTKRVIMDSGSAIQYDYLVLATGSNGPFPGKLDRMAPLMEMSLATEMYKLTLEKVIKYLWRFRLTQLLSLC